MVFEPSLSSFASRLLAACVARDRVQAVQLMRAHYDAIDVNVRALLAPFLEANAEIREGVAR